MARGVDRLADVGDVRGDAGRGLVVDDADGLDLVLLVLAQAGFDGGRIGGAAPIGFDEFGIEAQLLRHGLPQRGEVAGLEHQDLVAGGEHIDESRFPRAGARGREQEDVALGLEDGLDARQHAQAQLLEFRAAVIEHRLVHRPQDAIGHRRGAGNLQEMASGNARLIGRHKSSGQALIGPFVSHVRPPADKAVAKLPARTHFPRRGRSELLCSPFGGKLAAR